MKFRTPRDTCGALQRIYGTEDALEIAWACLNASKDFELRASWADCIEKLQQHANCNAQLASPKTETPDA
jgi:hypothetical protein